jgi:hypothetical protein
MPPVDEKEVNRQLLAIIDDIAKKSEESPGLKEKDVESGVEKYFKSLKKGDGGDGAMKINAKNKLIEVKGEYIMSEKKGPKWKINVTLKIKH